MPKLRFPEFTEPWEQRKLGDISHLITKGTTPRDKSGSGEVNFIKVENISSDNGEIINTSKISMEEHEGYLKRSQLKENDILFSIAGTLGRVSMVKSSILPANTNQALAIIRLKEGVIEYVTTVLKGKAVEEFIKRNPTVGAQPNLSLEQVNGIEIPFPNREEQKAIGNYFFNLNHLITLHQRKLDILKKYKRGLLQKMFPRNGAKVPEIRFPSFTGDWEQRKFDSITFPSGEKNRSNLPYESYSVTNENGFIPQNEQFENGGTMATADKSMYYIVSKNSFAYNPARINVGSIGYYEKPENVIVSSLYEVFKTTEDIDDRFLWHWFKSDAFQKMIEQYQEGGVRLYFYYDKLCMCSLSVPSIQEQRKIGKQLDAIDRLITLHQRKLDSLQQYKKGLLQQMFI